MSRFQRANLPFSEELHLALPKAWKNPWPTINPSGACDVLAHVHARRRVERTQIEITPRPESSLRLLIKRSPQPGVRPWRHVRATDG